MARKIADCRDFPSEMNCTLTISGEEDEVGPRPRVKVVDRLPDLGQLDHPVPRVC